MKKMTSILLVLIFPLQILGADVVFKKSKVVVFETNDKGEMGQDEKEALITFGDKTVTIQGLKTDYATRTEIEYAKIDQMIYERSSHSRVAAAILISPLALFVKRKHHWFTFHYTGEDSTNKSILLRLDKKDEKAFRQIAPQRTGKEVETIIE